LLFKRSASVISIDLLKGKKIMSLVTEALPANTELMEEIRSALHGRSICLPLAIDLGPIVAMLSDFPEGDPDSPSAAIVIHHPSDQCSAEVVKLVDWIRCHPGPIVAFLDAAATLQADGELTPISPLYGSIGCEIHYLSDDPAGPIVAIRGAAK
jgi:hypothetical protein